MSQKLVLLCTFRLDWTSLQTFLAVFGYYTGEYLSFKQNIIYFDKKILTKGMGIKGDYIDLIHYAEPGHAERSSRLN